MDQARRVSKNPLFWVPSLYFAMGIPNATVSVVSAIMYKNLGYSNETIVLYTSQMHLPWVLKPLWAHLLEPYRTKRFWVLAMRLLVADLLSGRASATCHGRQIYELAKNLPRAFTLLNYSSAPSMQAAGAESQRSRSAIW